MRTLNYTISTSGCSTYSFAESVNLGDSLASEGPQSTGGKYIEEKKTVWELQNGGTSLLENILKFAL